MLKYRKTATRVYFLIKQFKKKSLHFFMHGVITFIAFVYVNFPLVQKYLVFFLYTRCINNYYNTSVGTGETSYN
jgi:hypothetical protein